MLFLCFSCAKIGILFKFSDCRSVSLVPPKSSATATVLDVTVTAEASNKREAKKMVATELLHKLGWDQRVDEVHSLQSKKSTVVFNNRRWHCSSGYQLHCYTAILYFLDTRHLERV